MRGWRAVVVGAALLAAGCSTSRRHEVAAAPRPITTAGTAAATTDTPTTTAAAARIAVIGDSYTSGWQGVGTGNRNWTARMSGLLIAAGVPNQLTIAGVPGSGYVARGIGDTTFAEHVGGAVTTATDVVLVVGSRNDEGLPLGEVETAATATFAAIHTAAPHALLIVVGPIWVDEHVPVGITALSATLRRAATTSGDRFVDPLAAGWFAGDDTAFIGDDHIHPTDAGQGYLAARVEPIVALAIDDQRSLRNIGRAAPTT